jgi:hypothetical protein
MARWFSSCKTAEQGKALYRELVRKFHPDNGYTGDELKEINVEFKIWWKSHKDIHQNAEGKTYTAEHETTETAEEFMEIISNLSTLSGIEIEICGSWLWISGNTYPVRVQLSEFGCRWSRGKKKWYWTKTEYSGMKYKKPTMEEIRLRYGSQKVTPDRRAMLA